LSDHHKRSKNIISNKKAFSSIVGAIFAVLVIVSLTGTFFVWSLQQNSLYVNAVSGVNQLVLDQKSESINVTNTPVYTGSGVTVSVAVEIQNDGPISVNITTLWVQYLEGSKPYGHAELNLPLSPGQRQPISQSVQLSGSATGSSFYGWLITARGNVFPLYPAHQTGPAGPQGLPGDKGYNGTKGDTGPMGPPSVTALISQGIGSISMDFKSFRTYVVNSSNGLGTPGTAYAFVRTQNMAFSVNVTNLDPSQMFLNLTYYSRLWIVSPASGAIKGNIWQIALVTDNVITPMTQNQFIILDYNVTKTVYFGPSQAGVSNIDAGITAVNLVLTGKIGTLDYGQNLPFISLIAT